MALELILKEAQGMSDEALMEVLHYMQFIKITAEEKTSKPPRERKRRIGGIYEGKIRIDDDFDKPLDDFVEYS